VIGLDCVYPETAILAVSGIGTRKCHFPVPPIFNDLQSPKMLVHPCTGFSARLSRRALNSVHPETAILAVSGIETEKCDFPVPPIFNDLQSSKMSVHPCTGFSARLSRRALNNVAHGFGKLPSIGR